MYVVFLKHVYGCPQISFLIPKPLAKFCFLCSFKPRNKFTLHEVDHELNWPEVMQLQSKTTQSQINTTQVFSLYQDMILTWLQSTINKNVCKGYMYIKNK